VKSDERDNWKPFKTVSGLISPLRGTWLKPGVNETNRAERCE